MPNVRKILGNGKIYFFKGNDYYKFDPDRNLQEKEGYPRNVRKSKCFNQYTDFNSVNLGEEVVGRSCSS